MRAYREHLVSQGLAESRSYAVDNAMSSMHTALALMDAHNIRVFNQLYPGVAEAVNIYVAFNEGLALICEAQING